MQAERERLQAAEDSQTLAYQVRNYFPHPIAIRREQIHSLPHDERRITKILECGEHLATLLALLAIVQLGEASDSDDRLPSQQLRDYCSPGSLALDWGKCVSVLMEGAAMTARHPNPLALPFPQLGILNEALTDPDSPWSTADRLLRRQRNDLAHLQRRPAHELDSISRECTRSLDAILSETRFLASLRVALVEDYALDPVRQRRSATFRFLQGSSPVFSARTERVDRELPRRAVGIFGHDGRFRPLNP